MIDRNSFLPYDQQYDLSYLLQHAKAEVLLPFMQDIVKILMKEGFSLQQIIESLSECLDSRPQFQTARNYIELAAEEIGKVEQLSNSTEETNEAI